MRDRDAKVVLSPTQVSATLEAQGGACKCCSQPLTGTPIIDAPGPVVRGLICEPCRDHIEALPRTQRYVMGGWSAVNH